MERLWGMHDSLVWVRVGVVEEVGGGLAGVGIRWFKSRVLKAEEPMVAMGIVGLIALR